MTFEEFIKVVGLKVGPNATFGLSRDARFSAIEKILIDKGIATQDEIEAEIEKSFGELAEKIEEMPPIPNDKNAKQES